MKKWNNYMLTTIAILSLVLACTKEVSEDILSSFELEVSDTELESFLQLPEPVEVIINTLENMQPGDYQLKYNVTEGSGYYIMDGDKIEENIYVDLTGISTTINYVGTTVGNNSVIITVRNKQNKELHQTLTYLVNDTSFIFEVIPAQESVYATGIMDLNVSLVETDPSIEATYETKYIWVNVDPDTAEDPGRIVIDGEAKEPDRYFTITPGEVTWQFEGTSVGSAELMFTTKSSLEAEMRQSLILVITDTPDYEFTAVLEDGDEITNTPVVIHFNLEEIADTSTYTMTYVSDTQGEFSYNGITYPYESEIPVTVGQSSGIYTGDIDGNHQLDFTVTNSNQIPVEKDSSVHLIWDTTAPVITLLGSTILEVDVFNLYVEPDYRVDDNIDTDLKSKVEISGLETLNTDILGSYELLYDVKDTAGNSADTETRRINVVDRAAPIITLKGRNPQDVVLGETYNELGAQAEDNIDGNLTNEIEITGIVDTDVLGTYSITYTVSDSSGNIASLIRTIRVNDPPVAIINATPHTGNKPLTVHFSNKDSSVDSDGAVFSSTWNFGDGSETIDSFRFPYEVSHTYDRIGTYDVLLTILDNLGGMATARVRITVNNPDDPDPDPCATCTGNTEPCGGTPDCPEECVPRGTCDL